MFEHFSRRKSTPYWLGGFPLVLYWDWLRDRSIACSKTGSRDNSVMNGVTWLQRGRGSKEKYIVIEKQSVQSTLLYKHSPQQFRSPNSECVEVYCLWCHPSWGFSYLERNTITLGYVFHGRTAQSGMRNEVAWHARAFDAPRYIIRMNWLHYVN
jgi:hypothetical protein